MTEKEIFDIFDADGLLSRMLSSFEYREGQQLMATDAFNCMKEPSVYAVEAGTGIGKSFAYLVPALTRAFADEDDRTVVATSTINLQKQIVENDIPALFKAFSQECRVELAVGRNHYLCKRKMMELYRVNELAEQAGIGKLSGYLEFARTTETGLFTDYKGDTDPEISIEISSDSDTCRGPKCPYYSSCFYFKAKRRLSDASVIICNHHLLLTDCLSRMESQADYSDEAVLPPFSHLIIDEAHNLEKNATDLFTKEFSSNAVHRQLDYIFNPVQSKKKNDSDRNILLKLSSYVNQADLVQDIINTIDSINSQADYLNTEVVTFMLSHNLSNLYVNRQNVGKVMESVGTVCNNMVLSGSNLVDLMSRLLRKVPDTEETEVSRNQFSSRLTKINSMVEVLKEFTQPQSWSEDIHYIENIRTKRGNVATFNIAPIEVAPILSEHLFQKIDSVLCTSATMDLNDDFAFWSRETGLPAGNKKFVRHRYASPFDYRKNLMLLTPVDSLAYNNDDIDSYRAFLVNAIKDAVSSSGGGALVLFTNAKLMKEVYEELSPVIKEETGVNCYVQGQLERYRLMEKFKKDIDSVLFATNSFWEGVDAPGNTLRLVIITKLPFTMPTDPVFKARSEKIEKEKGFSPFMYLSLPEAMMKLKQGYGRLMRHATDKGIVLILDSRISSKGYGAIMLSNLPESYHPQCRLESISSNIEQFLY
ncbi:MAG: ATP-dependent DNA helicase [Sphaerochaetaceae bacterium]|nr:ATP-dependent DNA helicase [Sphaerochaetaceae bacterium]